MNATGGDTRLGGEDFDANVVKFLSAAFLKQHKDVTLTQRALRRQALTASTSGLWCASLVQTCRRWPESCSAIATIYWDVV